MRADRLLTILSLLQTHSQLSSRELAHRLEVSERTVHRDMEALSAAGFPVYAERGSRGGWMLSEGYRSHLTGMTTDEIQSLLLLHSSSVVKDLGLNEQAQTAFFKLLSALPTAAQRDAEYVRERIHVDGAGWHSSSPSNTLHLQDVQEAVWKQRKLRISYRSWDSDADTVREVCPLGLVAKLNVWYMVALTEEEEIRSYRISRLSDTKLQGITFIRPESFDLAAYWERSTSLFKSSLPRYPAQVRIASTHWTKFIRERYVKIEDSSDSNEDGGWVNASVEFNTLESACEILLGYGRHARAISPVELNQAIREECLAVTALYENS